MRRRQALMFGAAALTGLGLGWHFRPKGATSSGLPSPLSEMGWTLTDQTGRTVTPSDWAGKPAMVFFGFTFCPDVCPTTLANISLWLEEMGTEADKLVVAFLTVDPERDTPEVMAAYLEFFDPRVTGLTGTLDEITKAAQDFRVDFRQVATDDGYTMDHSAGVYLFRANGQFAGTIDFHEEERFAVPKIRRILG